MTLGGVSLPMSEKERTASYIESYRRLRAMQDGVEVSLPNHPEIAEVLERAERLKTRQPGDPHPFVDSEAYRASLASLIASAEVKLEQERSDTAARLLAVEHEES
jgi:metallo-beta-lactamase class B